MISVNKICVDCAKEFESFFVFGTFPSRCETCRDLRKKKDLLTKERQVLQTFEGVRLETDIPWVECEKPRKGFQSWKYIRKGDYFGVSWVGRIDLFTEAPFQKGDCVNIKEMLVTKIPRESQSGESGEEIRRYFQLKKSAIETPALELYLVDTRYKTTLKGFGRQYSYKLEVSSEPLLHKRAAGSVRSGRRGGTTHLLVVPVGTTVEVVTEFDYSGGKS